MGYFDKAFDKLIEFEGGYVNDPDDDGGETKYGISRRTYPDLNIGKLTLCDAREIYYNDFWLVNRYDEISSILIVIKLFDMSANMGARNSHANLQRALMSCGVRLKWDGILGPKTRAATNDTRADLLLVALRSEQASYYERLIASRPEMDKFRSGWMKRAYS